MKIFYFKIVQNVSASIKKVAYDIEDRPGRLVTRFAHV